MNIHLFERFVAEEAGERLVSPVAGRALVLVHVLDGEVGFTAGRRERERVPFPGSRDGWTFSGRDVWADTWESGVLEPGLSRFGFVDQSALSDRLVRVAWSTPGEFVLGVVSV